MLKLKTFFRAVEKSNKIEMKKWISNFMIHLRKFYINDELAFVYNDLSKEFGVATADIKVFNRGNDREYFSSYFENFLTKYWEHLRNCLTGQKLRCVQQRVLSDTTYTPGCRSPFHRRVARL